jgi:hypothetical protein
LDFPPRPEIITPVAIPRQRRSLGELLEAAQASITRWKPADAALAIDQGATLIDIRSDLDPRA